MRTYVIPTGCTTVDGLKACERPEPKARPGQVLVRVRATSLNYRDQAVITGTYFGGPATRDMIPISDGAGEVIATGDGVKKFKVGDRVVATFSQRPPDGPAFLSPAALGSPLDGILVEQIALYEDGLLPIPSHLSFEEAACLPCAGVTAWNALSCAGTPVTAGDIVLLLGTGGVSMFALQFARAAGAQVIATSSSDEKLARARAFGAFGTVNYTRIPDWHKEVLKLTDGRGVDCVVEVGGVGTMERSFDSLAHGGKVALIGVLTGRSANINPYALMWKEGSLYGIRLGNKSIFESMNRAIQADGVKPIIDRTFAFDDALTAYRYQAAGDFVGKVVIKI